jgi:Rhodopirellula transposase DDE domain
LIGPLYRAGQLYTQAEVKVQDHDWPSLATGVAIPHGLYDQSRNEGYIQIGTSHDTGEFACDSLWYWWENYGSQHYPMADAILVLCDGGGSNSSRQYLFKQDLQFLVNDMGIPIRIAHYPPHTSKYNPIEHRLFPHVTRACQGVIFETVEMVEELVAKAKTKTGLKVFATILDGIYETGRQVTTEFKENMKIMFDDYLPQWNYTAVPELG